ncbi:MAG: NUDIX hydrolase [Thermoplasmatales archaeon]|nr:NUDIX hydrolase [Thermoplasmatales archaeon]
MRYKGPSITADGILIKNQQILLVKRKNQPFKGKWALPGGFVEYGEKTEDTVIREVLEETGLKTKINQLAGVYSDPDRDPRGHTITVAYILDIIGGELVAGDDASDVKFFNVKELPDLSFDHSKIINEVLQRFYHDVLSKM